MKANGATAGNAAAAPARRHADADAPGVAPRSTGMRPIVTRHVADDVVDRLVTAVALGLYVTGQQLPTERELAVDARRVAHLGARGAASSSPTTGYLEVRRGRNGGYFVLANWGPASAEHVRRQIIAQLAGVRADLRRPHAGRAADRAHGRRRGGRPSDMRAMASALQAYLDAPDHDASRRADAALHLAIAEATHNPILVGDVGRPARQDHPQPRRRALHGRGAAHRHRAASASWSRP